MEKMEKLQPVWQACGLDRRGGKCNRPAGLNGRVSLHGILTQPPGMKHVGAGATPAQRSEAPQLLASGVGPDGPQDPQNFRRALLASPVEGVRAYVVWGCT